MAGAVQLLLILGANPVYTAPVDLGFADAMQKVGTRVHLGLYVDETAAASNWHIPRNPFPRGMERRAGLRRHGEHRAAADRAALPGRRARRTKSWRCLAARRQVLRPGARVLAGQQPGRRFRDVVARRAEPRRRSPTQPCRPSRQRWTQAAVTAAVARRRRQAAGGGLEIIFRPDPAIWDGRFAQQRLAAGAAQAAQPADLGQRGDDEPGDGRATGRRAGGPGRGALRRPDGAGRGLDLAGACRQRGHGPPGLRPDADGPRQRRVVERGRGQRHRSQPEANRQREPARQRHRLQCLRAAHCRTAPWFGPGAEVVKIGGKYKLATTQFHWQMEGRDLVKTGTLAEYQQNPNFAADAARADLALPAVGVPELQVGHGDRPDRLRRVQRVRGGVPGREQHARRSARKASTASARCTGCGSIATTRARTWTTRRPSSSRCRACSARPRRARWCVPVAATVAQRRRPERHGLQPLRGHPLLLEQLPVQGAALQLLLLHRPGRGRSRR